MNVDYRLLARFEASRQRHDAARRALPHHWRTDPRPEAQVINDHWVDVMARAAEQRALIAEQLRARTPDVSVDDR